MAVYSPPLPDASRASLRPKHVVGLQIVRTTNRANDLAQLGTRGSAEAGTRSALLVAVLLVACSSKSDPADGASPAPTVSAEAAPAVTVAMGDDIVAATSKVAFTQGKVVKIEPDKVTFEFGRPDPKTRLRPRKSVPGIDAYRIADAAAADGAPLSKGDNLICHVVRRKTTVIALPTWYPCHVLEVRGSKIRVEDHYGTKYDLDPERVIKPREATQNAIATYIATELKHRKFDRDFEAAGHPVRPAGWVPAVAAPIVIHWVGTSWYSGTVVAVKKGKGKVRVQFEGDRWNDRDVAATEVAPQPNDATSTGPAPQVAAEQFVIVRPSAADERWEHNRVLTVNGETLEVVDRNGKKTSVPRKNVVPIVPDGN